MYSVDRDNFKRFLINFPKQIADSQKIFKNNTPRLSKSFQNIIYLGMGGSAIAGNIIREVLYDNLKLPLQVVRGYDIPGFCSNLSLVIASSYSGNTEETLSAVTMAAKKGAKIVAVTSGGELLKLAKKKKWPVLKVPEGFPPRQAFGYLFFLAYQVILKTINKKISAEEFKDLVHFSESMVQVSDEMSGEGKTFTKDLALRLKNKIPIIYSSAPYLSTVATRWKNQFQENAKSMAFDNVIPEMNHNEIVGWEMDSLPKKNYLVIFLEHDETNSRINKRLQLTKSIIQDTGTEVVEIYAEGDSLLTKTISLIIKGDWISYYLALFYEKNPASIVNIDYLKSELKKDD
jgi:glucose/mannose-6-phosphate isomerase